MISKNTRAYACAIAVSILWGLSFIGAKEALSGGLTTFSLVMVRLFVASAILFLCSLVRKEKLAVRPKDFLLLALTAVTGITIYYYCELKGLQYTSASVASLIIATIPVFSLLAGVVFYRKKTSVLTWTGVFLSLLGVYLLVFTDAGENSARGFLLLFCACFCWVFYLEVTDRLLRSYSNLTITFWQNLIALLTVIPLACTEHVPWRSVPLNAWLWAVVFLGVVCSGLCYLMNNYSIAALSPQMNSVFLNLSPVATAAGGYLILGETITPMQLTGGLIILVSLFIVSFADHRRKAADAARNDPR